MNPSTRIRATRLAAALVVAGCGGDADPNDTLDTGVSEPSSTSSPVDSASTSESPVAEPDAAESNDPAAAEETMGDADDPAGDTASVPATDHPIASRLPIAEVIEFDDTIWRLGGDAGGIAVASGAELHLVRGGSVSDVPLDSGLIRMELLYYVANDTHIVVHGTQTRWNDANTLVSIDRESLETQALVVPSGSRGMTGVNSAASTGFGSFVVATDSSGVRLMDSSTFEFTGPTFPGAEFDGRFLLDDELWSVDEAGAITVADIRSGETLRTGSLDRSVGFQPAVLAGSTDTHVWIASRVDQAVATVDRATLEVVDWYDVSTALDGLTSTLVGFGDSYVLLNVFDGTDSWYVLGTIDPATNALADDYHVVSQNSRDYFGTFFDGAEFAVSGDDLWVRDHERRIVRVDLDRWGDQSGPAWTPPDLPIVAERTGAEADVAALTIGWLDGDDIARTDPGLVVDREATAAILGDGERIVTDIDIFGERAFVMSRVGTEAVPMVSFVLIDGVWTLDSTTECWAAVQGGISMTCPDPTN